MLCTGCYMRNAVDDCIEQVPILSACSFSHFLYPLPGSLSLSLSISLSVYLSLYLNISLFFLSPHLFLPLFLSLCVIISLYINTPLFCLFLYIFLSLSLSVVSLLSLSCYLFSSYSLLINSKDVM